MSCRQGALKQVIALYKSHLKSCLQSSISIASHDNIVDPFLCMNIKCPPGSYDPNIEPAKDDVLFLDPEGLLKTVESFFTHIYGQIKPPITDLRVSSTPPPRKDGFELLLNEKVNIVTPVSGHSGWASRGASSPSRANKHPEPEDASLERSSDVLSLVNNLAI